MLRMLIAQVLSTSKPLFRAMIRRQPSTKPTKPKRINNHFNFNTRKTGLYYVKSIATINAAGEVADILNNYKLKAAITDFKMQSSAKISGRARNAREIKK